MSYPIRTLTLSEGKNQTGDIYPARLKEIPEPPKQLFLRGAPLIELEKPVAIVGARQHSTYGKSACERIIQGLTNTSITVISGLALGIDALAHTFALQHKVPTIAILGSGIDDASLYPITNKQLAYKILENGGTLISEYPEGTKATRYTFPERNRIIAGMSDLVIAVECGKRSGTRITTRLAVEYGRDVGAVPQSIFSEVGEGTNELIKQGAYPITHSDDILALLQIEVNTSAQVGLNFLSTDERLVYEHLEFPKTKTQLTEETKLPIEVLQTVIISLEMKNLAKEVGGLIQRSS